MQRKGVTRYVRVEVNADGSTPDPTDELVTTKHSNDVRYSCIVTLDPHAPFRPGFDTAATKVKAERTRAP